MKFSIIKTYLLFVAVTFVIQPSAASAGYAQAGYISAMYVSNGVVSFETSSLHISPPACQPEANGRLWSFDASTAKGQVMLSVILSAQAQGKKVFIGGTSTCDPRSDVEGVYAVTIP